MQSTKTFLGLAALAGSSLAANHMVKVGAGGLTYTPPITTAASGDTVTFQFVSEHNVIQAAQDSPCMPMSGGFWSTTIEPDDNMEFVLTVNDTQPTYFYCGYDGHCSFGMVGAINAPNSDLSSFKAAALKVSESDVEEPMSKSSIGGVLAAPGSTTNTGSSGSGGSGMSGSDSDNGGDNDNDGGNSNSNSNSNSDSDNDSGDKGPGMFGAASATGAPLALAALAAAAIAGFTL